MPVSASVLFSGKGHPAWNMAVDEALLLCTQQNGLGGLILRFYEWDRLSTTIGYFQKFSQVDFEGYVVRRPTGGGTVCHRTDLTYSLIFPQGLFGSVCAYRFIHDLVRDVLSGIPDWEGSALLPASMAAEGRINRCFEQPSAHDVMLGGRKLAGAAQRRSKGWILHQGSMDLGVYDTEALRMQLATGLMKKIENWCKKEISTRELTVREAGGARELFEKRYATDAWNKKF